MDGVEESEESKSRAGGGLRVAHLAESLFEFFRHSLGFQVKIA